MITWNHLIKRFIFGRLVLANIINLFSKEEETKENEEELREKKNKIVDEFFSALAQKMKDDELIHMSIVGLTSEDIPTLAMIGTTPVSAMSILGSLDASKSIFMNEVFE